MTNWRDPAHELSEGFSLIKLEHFMGGLYIWEFVLNLDYEYSVVVGKRKFTRSFPFYVLCRWCTLFAVIGQFLLMDLPTVDHCQAVVSMAFASGSLAVVFSSLLVVLRVCALWQHNKIIIAIVYIFWLGNASFLTYSVVESSAYPIDGICESGHVLRTRISVLSTITNDLVLLVLMLFGILRWKGARERAGGIWRLLYAQGLAWIVVFTLSEVPPSVLVILNLSDYMDLMCLVSGMIAMAICASRMYRGLVNSDAFNGPPMGVIDAKITTRIWLSSPSTPSCFAEGADTVVDEGLAFRTA